MAWFSCDILSQQILNMQTIGTASGSVASFSTDVTEDLINCNCQFAATQASGTPTPSAPIPINPVNSIAVTRTGKNICGGSKLLANAQAYLPSGTTDLDNKTFRYSTTTTATSGLSFTSGIKFKENTAYTFIMSIIGTSGYSNLQVVYTDDTTANIPNPSASNTKEVIRFVSNANKTVKHLRRRTAGGSTIIYYEECGIFEGNISTTDFEPYNGVTKTLALGGDYYGGEVDALSGEITSNVKKIVIDGSQTVTVATSNYIKSDACDGFINVDDVYPNVSYVYQDFNFRSNKLAYADKKNIWQITGYPNCFVVNNKQFHLNIANDLLGITDYTQETTASVKQKITDFLTNNPIEVIYCVAPLTAQASNAIEINTLLGDNNIYCDTGNTSVTYLETIKNHYNL